MHVSALSRAVSAGTSVGQVALLQAQALVHADAALVVMDSDEVRILVLHRMAYTAWCALACPTVHDPMEQP